LWNGTLTALNIGQQLLPYLEAAGPMGEVAGTVLNAAGSLFNGINEALQVHEINKQIKAENKRLDKEIAEDNARAHREAEAARIKREKEEKAMRDNYLERLEAGKRVWTQQEIDLANSFSDKDRQHLENMKASRRFD
jgi:hypothetical protein